MLVSEKIAKELYETYGKLTPEFEPKTRRRTDLSWEKAPQQNKDLMIAVVKNLMRRGVLSAGSKIKRRASVRGERKGVQGKRGQKESGKTG